MAAIPTILKGDDSGNIVLTLATGRTYTGATLVVAYQGVTRSFTNLQPGGTVSFSFTHDETVGFALKTAPILMRLVGQYGAEETVENAEARIKVTDCLSEVNAGGSFVVRPGGGVEDPTKVPITDVGDMAARYTLADLQAKVNQIVHVLAQRSLLSLAVLLSSACCFASVQTARLDSLYNDSQVVTNVIESAGIETNGVNALIRSYDETNLTARINNARPPDYTTTNAVITISANQVTNDVAPWAMAGKTEPQGMTTNAVYSIVSNAVPIRYVANLPEPSEACTGAIYQVTSLTNSTLAHYFVCTGHPIRTQYTFREEHIRGGVAWCGSIASKVVLFEDKNLDNNAYFTQYIGDNIRIEPSSGQYKIRRVISATPSYMISASDITAVPIYDYEWVEVGKPDLQWYEIWANKQSAAWSGNGTTTAYPSTRAVTLWTDERIKQATNALARVANTGDYNDLYNRPTALKNPYSLGIYQDNDPAVWYNGTQAVVIAFLSKTNTLAIVAASTNSLATVAHTGSYNDLANKPTIPAPYVPSPTDATFSNAVLAVGLNIDTNSVAVLNEIAASFGGFPIAGTATTVGGLLAALAAAIAWLRKRKIDKITCAGVADITTENGTANVSALFSGANTSLTSTIGSTIAARCQSLDPVNSSISDVIKALKGIN